MTTYHTIPVEKTTLHYKKTGSGSQALLLFHGFGQDHTVFNALTESLSQAYTLYIFDLFFHGKSDWNQEEQPLEKKFFKEIMHHFFLQNNLNACSVLGFSMGGKFALATAEAFPECVKEIFLLAPDGIKTSMWYWLATYPVALRNLFKGMIKKPNRFKTIATFAFRTGLIDRSILRFVELQMNTEEKRNRVYHAWVVFRHLTFDMGKIAGIVNKNDIRLVLILGKFDKVITAKNMNGLLRYVNHYQLEISDTGHHGVIEASIKILNK